MAITLLKYRQARDVACPDKQQNKEIYIMANPFGLPRVILAEREARRRRQFRACVYTLLITATILIMGTLIQGCRTQKPPASGEVAQTPMVRTNCLIPRQATNPLPTPMAQSDSAADTNWITPQSASLPENVTLPAPTSEPMPMPGVHKAPAHHAAGIYVVKHGDTLARIARAHGTTVKALKNANQLANDHIFVGEKLKLSQTKP